MSFELPCGEHTHRHRLLISLYKWHVCPGSYIARFDKRMPSRSEEKGRMNEGKGRWRMEERGKWRRMILGTWYWDKGMGKKLKIDEGLSQTNENYTWYQIRRHKQSRCRFWAMSQNWQMKTWLICDTETQAVPKGILRRVSKFQTEYLIRTWYMILRHKQYRREFRDECQIRKWKLNTWYLVLRHGQARSGFWDEFQNSKMQTWYLRPDTETKAASKWILKRVWKFENENMILDTWFRDTGCLQLNFETGFKFRKWNLDTWYLLLRHMQSRSGFWDESQSSKMKSWYMILRHRQSTSGFWDESQNSNSTPCMQVISQKGLPENNTKLGPRVWCKKNVAESHILKKPYWQVINQNRPPENNKL